MRGDGHVPQGRWLSGATVSEVYVPIPIGSGALRLCGRPPVFEFPLSLASFDAWRELHGSGVVLER